MRNNKYVLKTTVLVLAAVMLSGCFTSALAPNTTPGLTATPTQTTQPPVTGSPSQSPTSTATTQTPTPTETPTEAPTEAPTVQPSPTPSNDPTKAPSFEPVVPTALFTIGPWQPEKQPPAGYNLPYSIEVDVANAVVNIYKKNEETGLYDVMINRFVCSPGKNRNTPEGVFELGAYYKEWKSFKNVWMYFPESDNYARYSTRIHDTIMFHSILFDKRDANTPIMKTYYELGTQVSSGCIRLLVEHAKWIYDYVPRYTFCNITYKKPKSIELQYAIKRPDVYGDPVSEKTMQTPPPSATTAPTTTPKVTPSAPTPTPTATPTATPTPVVTPSPTPAVTAQPTPQESSMATDGNEDN